MVRGQWPGACFRKLLANEAGVSLTLRGMPVGIHPIGLLRSQVRVVNNSPHTH